MIHQEYQFTSSGTNLYCQHWLPHNKLKAKVVVIHGGGDHSGRFQHITDYFIPRGYGVFIFDLRGHGRSPGKRGHIESWSVFRKDVGNFIGFIQENHPAHPLILFGHSMGAAIVLDYCLHSTTSIDGVIATSPAIGKLGIPAILFPLARFLNKFLPSLVLPNGLNISHLSRDKDFVRKTKKDPLYHTKSTPRLGMELMKTIESIQDHAPAFKLPLLVVHGTGDRIASIEGSRFFVQSVKSNKVTYQEFCDGYHELFNDLDKIRVLEVLVDWMDQLVNSHSSSCTG